MATLTKAQKEFLKYIDKTRREIYFRRDTNGREQCFIGRKKVNTKVFFFFYDIGYLRIVGKVEGRKYEYFYMDVVGYKLNEYLDDFIMPYCVPE